jgi:hypothetical protein
MIGNHMSDYWISFVQSGKPEWHTPTAAPFNGTLGDSKWPRFHSNSSAFLHIGLPFAASPSSYGTGMCAFWDDFRRSSPERAARYFAFAQC